MQSEREIQYEMKQYITLSKDFIADKSCVLPSVKTKTMFLASCRWRLLVWNASYFLCCLNAIFSPSWRLVMLSKSCILSISFKTWCCLPDFLRESFKLFTYSALFPNFTKPRRVLSGETKNLQNLQTVYSHKRRNIIWNNEQADKWINN